MLDTLRRHDTHHQGDQIGRYFAILATFLNAQDFGEKMCFVVAILRVYKGFDEDVFDFQIELG
jgi:hypothetical protein